MKYLYSMSMLLLMLISFSISSFSSPDNDLIKVVSNDTQCTIKVEVKFPSHSEIEFEVTSATAPIKYFVIDGNNKTVSEGSKKVSDLKKGKYKYFIHDSGGCWKKGDFEIK